MEIIFLGHSSFRIKTRSATIVTDPFDPKKTGQKFPRVSADIVTISHDHTDHNNVESIDGNPKIVTGPGEYEIGGVTIAGIASWHDNKRGQERGPNTIYVIEDEGIRLCHLGDLGHKLTDGELEAIGPVNILAIPVGGVYTIDAKEASVVVSQIEPNIVLPMHYKTPGLNPEVFGKLDPLENFIREIGIEPVRETRFQVSIDKLPQEMQVVVLGTRD